MQSEIDDHVVEAVGRHAASHLIGIYGAGKISSGVAVILGDRFFIATVEHHLRRIPEGEIVLVHTDSPTSAKPSILRRFPGFEEYESGPDLGFIELQRDVGQSLDREFLPAERLLTSSPAFPNFGYVVTGYPFDVISKELSSAGIWRFEAMSFGVAAVDPRNVPDSEPDLDIYLKYEERGRHIETGRRLDSPHPGGMSGGGIWGVPRKLEGGLWDPSSALLLGIQCSFRSERHFLRGIQIQHWLYRVARQLPELAPVVAGLVAH